MTYRQALEFLFSFIDYEKKKHFSCQRKFNTSRMKQLLVLLDNPQKHIRTVLIAGTNGKGATARILQGILAESSYDIGLYTSPHLVDICERIRIGNKLITKKEFVYELTIIREVIEQRWNTRIYGCLPTVFEILTALAFSYFYHRSVDIAICEVGLGGRLDATNTAQPLISIITSIGYDHCDKLGSTLRKIAYEKAGIIKKQSWVVSAKQAPEVEKVLTTVTKKRGSCLLKYKEDFDTKNVVIKRQGSRFNFESIKNVYLPLRGDFQVENASLALKAADILKKHFSYRLDERAVRSALKKITWPGRLESMSSNALSFVLDGAHNRDAVIATIRHIRTYYRNKHIALVLGFSNDKEYDLLLKEFSCLSSSVILTRANHKRAVAPDVLSVSAKKYFKEVTITKSVSQAYKALKGVNRNNTVVFVGGSLFVVGDFRRILTKKKNKAVST